MKLGKFTRTVTKTKDPKNYMPGMAAVTYANKNIPIKKQKTVTLTNTKTGASRKKVVDYSPVDYYGKQTKTKTIIKKGKLFK